MDEAIELISSSTPLQKNQTILTVLLTGFTSFIFYISIFTWKQPSANYGYQNQKNNTNTNITNSLINSTIDIIHDDTSNYQNFIIVYFLIKFISSVILGYYTDKYGRQIIIFYAPYLIIASFIFFLIGYISNFFLMISYILSGICSYFYIFSSIITCEFLLRKKSALISAFNVFSGIFFAIFGILLEYNYHMLPIYIIIIICFIAITLYYIKLNFYESPHWLLSKNRINDCFDLLSVIAVKNNKESIYKNLNDERYKTDNIKVMDFTADILTVYSYPSQKKRLIFHFIIWICSSISFHGVIFLISGYSPLNASYLTNLIITFFIIIITQIITGFIADNYGRQSPLLTSFYISAFSFLIFALTDQQKILKTICYYIAVASSSINFSIPFIFTAEDFPTSVRGTVLGFIYGVTQILVGIECFIDNELILCLLISFGNCISGRIVESLEDPFDLLLDDNVPETQADKLRKKKYRALKYETKSSGSLYFLTSDDENFNNEAQYVI